MEFAALQCASCGLFCVQQVTKNRKWACRVCGAKQSIVKVYFRSYRASDVRPIVQQLSMARGRLEAEMPPVPCHAAEALPAVSKADLGASWAEYIDKPGLPILAHEDESRYTTTAPVASHPSKRVVQVSGFKRKTAGGDEHEGTTVSLPKKRAAIPQAVGFTDHADTLDAGFSAAHKAECEAALPHTTRAKTLQSIVQAQQRAPGHIQGESDAYVTSLPASDDSMVEKRPVISVAPAKASMWDEYL